MPKVRKNKSKDNVVPFNKPKVDKLAEEKRELRQSEQDRLKGDYNKKHADLIDTFNCQLIFYLFFCYSPHLYLFIDLWFGSFEENKLTTMNKFKK